MNFDHLSMAHSLIRDVLPAAAVAIGVSSVWLRICRWIYSAEERAWKEALLHPGCYEKQTLDAKLQILMRQGAMARRGSPADRLFIGGMVAASVVGVAALVVVCYH